MTRNTNTSIIGLEIGLVVRTPRCWANVTCGFKYCNEELSLLIGCCSKLKSSTSTAEWSDSNVAVITATYLKVELEPENDPDQSSRKMISILIRAQQLAVNGKYITQVEKHKIGIEGVCLHIPRRSSLHRRQLNWAPSWPSHCAEWHWTLHWEVECGRVDLKYWKKRVRTLEWGCVMVWCNEMTNGSDCMWNCSGMDLASNDEQRLLSLRNSWYVSMSVTATQSSRYDANDCCVQLI